MWDNVYNLIRDWQLPTVAMAFFGILLVIQQLRQIRRQNELTERSIRQTYRPIGVFFGSELGLKGSRLDEFKVTYNQDDSTYHMSLYFQCSVHSGILKLISLFTLKHTERIRDVKRHLLDLQKIVHRYIDVQLTDKQVHKEQLEIDKSLVNSRYLYVVALYLDQDDNLYGSVLGLGIPQNRTQHWEFAVRERFQHFLSFNAKEKDMLEKKVIFEDKVTAVS
ncbi:MAG: hypothetical protein QHI48_04370 [Bacteroidota bacterium]|nr:hypothetical protein [Bacteroidota bacterium]